MIDSEKVVLQQVKEDIWLVRHGDDRLGILNKDIQDHYTYVNGECFINFRDADEVKTHFSNMSLFEDQITASPVTREGIFINGHRVPVENPFVLEEDHPDYRRDLPLYAKVPDSQVYYAAGYYAIRFEKCWRSAHCPKLKTLNDYGYCGPFASLDQARQEVRRLNRAPQDG